METMYDTLLKLPLFQGLCHSDFTNIIGKVKLHFIKCKAGEVIIGKGEQCKDLTFLLKGEVIAESSDNKENFIFQEFVEAPFVMEPYSFFGMNTHYVSTYIAQTDVQLIRIDKNYIIQELNRYDIFRLNYLNIVGNRSQVFYDRVWNNQPETLEAAVVHFFCVRCEKLSGKKVLRIKMDDFALLLNETRNNVSKVLNDLQEKHLVQLRRKEIEVTEIKDLINPPTN